MAIDKDTVREHVRGLLRESLWEMIRIVGIKRYPRIM